MFTGIVETTGRAVLLRKSDGRIALTVRPDKRFGPLRKGQSVSVSGVCLTVTGSHAGKIRFDVVPQTLRLTHLGKLRAGSVVNLERALKFGARLDGHLVPGHVEGVGRIRRIGGGRNPYLEITCPGRLLRRIVKGGSVAVEGVSLTVSGRTSGFFRVHLVPHTLKITNLAEKKAHDPVHIETDIPRKRAPV